MKNIAAKLLVLIYIIGMLLICSPIAMAASMADFKQRQDYGSEETVSSVKFSPLKAGFKLTHKGKGLLGIGNEVSVLKLLDTDNRNRNYRMVITRGSSFCTLYPKKNNLRGMVSHSVSDEQIIYHKLNGENRDGMFINIFEVQGDRQIVRCSFVKYNYSKGNTQYSDGAFTSSKSQQNKISQTKNKLLYNILFENMQGNTQQKDGLAADDNSPIKQSEDNIFIVGFFSNSVISLILTVLQVVVLVGFLYFLILICIYFASVFINIDVVRVFSFGAHSIKDDYDETTVEFRRKLVYIVILLALVYSNRLVELIIYLLNLCGLYNAM